MMRNLTCSVAEAPVNHARFVAPRKLQALASRFRATTLVFQDGHGVSAPPASSGSGEWITANRANVNSLFVKNPSLLKAFSHFLEARFIGLILVYDGEWISYGWSSQPGHHPPHVPPWVNDLSAYWIFYCHTKEEFRGRGLYKQLLRRMVAIAYENESHPAIYVDALPINIASRRSIVSSGFNPAGVLTTYKFWLPRIAHIAVAGSWHRDQAHPPL